MNSAFRELNRMNDQNLYKAPKTMKFGLKNVALILIAYSCFLLHFSTNSNTKYYQMIGSLVVNKTF